MPDFGPLFKELGLSKEEADRLRFAPSAEDAGRLVGEAIDLLDTLEGELR